MSLTNNQRIRIRSRSAGPSLEVPEPGEPITPVIPDAPVPPADPDPGTPADPEEPATVPQPTEPPTPVVPETGRLSTLSSDGPRTAGSAPLSSGPST
jgi:hypothetical protein